MRHHTPWAVLLVAVAVSAVSQAADDSQRLDSLQTLASPGGTSSSSPSFGNSASIAAGTSDTKATLALSGYTPTAPLGDYFQYQLGGEAPVSTKGSTDEIDIGTVSGLTAGSSAHAEVSAMWWKHQKANVQKALQDICTREFPHLFKGGAITWDMGWLSDQDTGCDRSLFSADRLKKIESGFNSTIKQCNSVAKKKAAAGAVAAAPPALDPDAMERCDALKTTPLPAKVELSDEAKDAGYLRQRLIEIDQLERQAQPVTLLTLGIKANRQKDAYFNKTDLTTLITDHTTGYGVNLTWSRIQNLFGTLDGMYLTGFSYEKSYKSVNPTQICSPIKGSTSLSCPSGTIGPPPDMFSRILFAESRLIIVAGALAIAPRIEYDFTASQFAAKLPIYLAPNKDKVLTGGVMFGYVTHGSGFGVEVFVNKAFSFF